MLTLAKKQA